MERHRARDYDPSISRSGDRGDSDIGFSIRGAAQRKNSQDLQAQPASRPTSPRSYRSHSHSRSPSRRRDRPYRDRDEPDSARTSRGHYQSRNDDRYSSRYSSSTDRQDYSYSRSRQYYEPYEDHSDHVVYEDPALPPPSNGDADVSLDGKELPFLLIRGLKSNISESVLSKGLEKLYQDESPPQSDAAAPALSLPPGAEGPAAALLANLPLKLLPQPGAMPHSLKRVFVIRDRETDKSLSYGFAEYHTVSDAKAALAKAIGLGDKFTISSKKIDICYPHMGVFPVVVPGQFGYDPRYGFQLASGASHQYHDKRYYASPLEVNSEPPKRAESIPQPKDTRSTKKRPKEVAGIDALEDEGNAKKVKHGDAKELGIVNLWQKKQAELRGEQPEHSDTQTSSTMPGSSETAEETQSQSYIFKGTKGGKLRTICFLCSTEIPATVTPEQHAKGSQKHAALLQDDGKLKQALERMAKQSVAPDQTLRLAKKASQPMEYRDRAKERRIQEAKAGTTEKVKVSLKDVKKKDTAAPPPTMPVKPTYGKGMAMLQKAGWEEGAGLGSGGGITAPIEQMSYNVGVGLGHEGSKRGDANEEADRATRGGGGWLEKTKDVARERFERMQ